MLEASLLKQQDAFAPIRVPMALLCSFKASISTMPLHTPPPIVWKGCDLYPLPFQLGDLQVL